jgi:hypothetical protein
MAGLFAPVLAQALTLAVADRTETRVRVSGAESGWDAQTTPSATLALTTRRASWSLAYAPSFTALAIADPAFELLVFHNVSASALLRFDSTFVTLQQTAGYGERNFRLATVRAVAPDVDVPNETDTAADDAAPDGDADGEQAQAPPNQPTQAPPAQALAANDVVRFGSSHTAVGATHVLSRRSWLAESAGYSVSGGHDQRSQRVYPLQRGPTAGATFGYRPSRVDDLFSGVSAEHVVTDAVGDATVIVADERWAHRFSRAVRGELGAGLAFARSRVEGARADYDAAPVAAAAVTTVLQQRAGLLTATVNVLIAPAVDRTSGRVDERLQWNASLARRRNALTLIAATGGARSLYGSAVTELTSVNAALGAIVQFDEAVSWDSGVSLLWQSFARTESAPALWSAYTGLSIAPAALSL